MKTTTLKAQEPKEKRPVTPAFGAFITCQQKKLSVNGRRVTNKFIAESTGMSTSTYALLKKA